MDVSVVIVNYNTRELTRDCINSVINQTKDIDYEIIVVDNASTDGSVEMIRSTFHQVTLIAEKTNWGFGKANNIGAEQAKGDFLFLLNSDTILVNNALKILYQFIVQNPEIGICGGQLLDINQNKINSFGPYPTMLREILIALLPGKYMQFKPNHFTTSQLINNYIFGADMMINKQYFNRIHGFDTDFFMYSEDIDISYRMKKAGYKSAFIPNARIIHLVNQSSTESNSLDTINNIEKWSYSEDRYSRFIFYQKLFGAHYTKLIYFIHLIKSKLATLYFTITLNSVKKKYWEKYNTIQQKQFNRYLQHISKKR